jgi:predicted RNA binding protein YcfA (HicA-like mRNA interferase family)
MGKQKSQWPSTKAPRVLAALLRAGWQIKRHGAGSHRLLAKPGWPDYTFAYHDRVELGRGALKLLGEKTGLRPEDL